MDSTFWVWECSRQRLNGARCLMMRPFLRSAPQLMLYPGMAISLAVLGFNLLEDGLRDAFDPRLK